MMSEKADLDIKWEGRCGRVGRQMWMISGKTGVWMISW